MTGVARRDILLAEHEFFSGGGEGGAMPTIPAAQYRYQVAPGITSTYGYVTVWRGAPLALALSDSPALCLFMPQSNERRPSLSGPGMSGRKFLLYACDVRLCCVVQGSPQSLSVAADALWKFYGWCDAIAQMIRGGNPGEASAKSLITPSYPTGGDVVVWGEDFSITEAMVPMENAVLLTGRFVIQAEEQVTA